MCLRCNIGKGTQKEIVYVGITFSLYSLLGISRSYLAFLFHQLDSADSTISVDDDQKSWIAAFINLLSPIGCLIIGFIMDYFGRKFSVQSVFIPQILCWIIITFASRVEVFYLAALIQSVGTGMSICCATYVSEISTASHRGPLLGSIEIFYNVGILLCNLLMYFMLWSEASIVFAALSSLLLLSSFVLPESPTWLYSKGKESKAIETLTSLRSQDASSIEPEIEDLKKVRSSQVKTTFIESLQNCFIAWRQLLIVLVLFILQQNTGYGLMTLYVIMIADRLQIPYESTRVALLYAVACTAGSFITPFAFHKFGRKTVLAISAFGMAAASAIIAVHQLIYETQSEKPFAWIVPLALCLFPISASIGVLPIAFTMAGEMFPTESRGVLNGFYGSLTTLYRSFLFKILPSYLNFVGGMGVMWTFAGFAVLTALYGLFVLPETKGKTLNEVQEQYFKRKNSR